MDESSPRPFHLAAFSSREVEIGDPGGDMSACARATGDGPAGVESFAGEALAPSNGQLRMGINALIEAMKSALEGDAAAARCHIRSASASLAETDGEVDTPLAVSVSGTVRSCGGLAPWQVRRLRTHIEGNLGGTIYCEDLARLVSLSLSHFMRAFKESFGCAPHAFLIRRRMEHAQGLMLTTDEALGQIALMCGLADQSHLTRLFRKWVGESPAAWRRARMR